MEKIMAGLSAQQGALLFGLDVGYDGGFGDCALRPITPRR
jgi:hypothetical protein